MGVVYEYGSPVSAREAAPDAVHIAMGRPRKVCALHEQDGTVVNYGGEPPSFAGIDFKPWSVPRISFCTAGCERFPRCPPFLKIVNCSGAKVASSHLRSSGGSRKSF